jgi:type IX secretion system PorP/SprF family membrane protein
MPKQTPHYYSLFFLWLLPTAYLCAQDPTFSQFYANRIYLNPAFTGLESGLTMNAQARSHWTLIPGQFNIAFASVDLQEPYLKSGVGLTLWQFSEGEAALTTQSVAFNYAYVLPLTSDIARNVHNIHFGIRAGVMSRFIDWSKLTFSDQLDPVSGAVFGTAAVPLDHPTTFFDADFGIMWRSETNLFGKGTRSSLGATVSHLTDQDESLVGAVSRRPMRVTVHGGLDIPMNWIDGANRHQIAMSPNIKLDFQQGLSVMTLGLYAIYETLYVGALYQDRALAFDPRNTNSMIFVIGYKAQINKNQTILFGYSFDANTSGLSTRTGGSHELAVRYNINDVQLFRQGVHDKKGKRILNCKAFF